MFLRLVVLVAAATSVAFAATQTVDSQSCMDKADGKMTSLYTGISHGTAPKYPPQKSCTQELNSDVRWVGARVKCEWDCTTDDKYVQGEKITYKDILPGGITLHSGLSGPQGSEGTCRNGRTVAGAWACDNEDDCGDNSDETCSGNGTCNSGNCECTNGSSDPFCADPTTPPPPPPPATANPYEPGDLDSDILFFVGGCLDYVKPPKEFEPDTVLPYFNEQPLKGECSKRLGYKNDGVTEQATNEDGSTVTSTVAGFQTMCLKHPEHGKSGDKDMECQLKCSKAQCTIQYEFYDALTDGQQAGAIIGLILWLACIYVIPLWARKRDPNASKFGFGCLGFCCGFLGFLFVPCCTTVKDRSDEQGKVSRAGTEMGSVVV